MKSQKLIGIAAIAYLLLGGSGAAMGADVTCTDDNSDDPRARFVLNVSSVGGQVKVDGGSAAIIDSIVSSDKNRTILIKSVDGDTIVSGTTVQSTGDETASIVVLADLADSAKVLLYGNTVTNGNIKCVDKQNINTYAAGNVVPRGEITCFGQ